MMIKSLISTLFADQFIQKILLLKRLICRFKINGNPSVKSNNCVAWAFWKWTMKPLNSLLKSFLFINIHDCRRMPSVSQKTYNQNDVSVPLPHSVQFWCAQKRKILLFVAPISRRFPDDSFYDSSFISRHFPNRNIENIAHSNELRYSRLTTGVSLFRCDNRDFSVEGKRCGLIVCVLKK